MAEAIANHFLKDKLSAVSAGSKPTSVNPYAIEVMREIGIDISHHRSKPVSEFFGQEFEYVITVCGDSERDTSCPVFLGKVKYNLHFPFPDPALTKGNPEQIKNAFRKVRDQIKNQIEQWANSL